MKANNKTHHADHKPHLARIKRIEGQMRGIGRMIEEGQYCIDILVQLKAIKSAINSLELKVLEGHAHHCLKKAVDSGSKIEAQKKVSEIMELLKKSMK